MKQDQNNQESPTQDNTTQEKRKRRTAEESRNLILEVANRRLREHGLEGLNIKGIAEEAGISHATLLHHFGSSGGMREALVERMTHELVKDLVAAVDSQVPLPQLAGNVFSALAEGGHAKLIAWQAVERAQGEGGQSDRDMSGVAELFARLLDSSQAVMGLENREEVQRLTFLVAIAGIGYGLAGDVLADLVGMSEEDLKAFPQWMTERIN